MESKLTAERLEAFEQAHRLAKMDLKLANYCKILDPPLASYSSLVLEDSHSDGADTDGKRPVPVKAGKRMISATRNHPSNTDTMEENLVPSTQFPMKPRAKPPALLKQQPAVDFDRKLTEIVKSSTAPLAKQLERLLKTQQQQSQRLEQFKQSLSSSPRAGKRENIETATAAEIPEIHVSDSLPLAALTEQQTMQGVLRLRSQQDLTVVNSSSLINNQPGPSNDINDKSIKAREFDTERKQLEEHDRRLSKSLQKVIAEQQHRIIDDQRKRDRLCQKAIGQLSFPRHLIPLSTLQLKSSSEFIFNGNQQNDSADPMANRKKFLLGELQKRFFGDVRQTGSDPRIPLQPIQIQPIQIHQTSNQSVQQKKSQVLSKLNGRLNASKTLIKSVSSGYVASAESSKESLQRKSLNGKSTNSLRKISAADKLAAEEALLILDQIVENEKSILERLERVRSLPRNQQRSEIGIYCSNSSSSNSTKQKNLNSCRLSSTRAPAHNFSESRVNLRSQNSRQLDAVQQKSIFDHPSFHLSKTTIDNVHRHLELHAEYLKSRPPPFSMNIAGVSISPDSDEAEILDKLADQLVEDLFEGSIQDFAVALDEIVETLFKSEFQPVVAPQNSIDL